MLVYLATNFNEGLKKGACEKMYLKKRIIKGKLFSYVASQDSIPVINEK